MLTDEQLAILKKIENSIGFDGDERGETDKLVIEGCPEGWGSLRTHRDRREGAPGQRSACGRAAVNFGAALANCIIGIPSGMDPAAAPKGCATPPR